MEVPIRVTSNGQVVEPGAPVALFATRVPGGAVQPFPRHEYAVSGQRFLMVVEVDDPAPSPISLLLNWTGQKR